MVQNYRFLFSRNRRKQLSGHICIRHWFVWHHPSPVVVVYSFAKAAGSPRATSLMRAPKCRSTTLWAHRRVSHLTRHEEPGGPPWAQLFRILGSFSKPRKSNFLQPTFLPSPTNEPHVRQKAQEIIQTFTKTHPSGDSYQYRYCSTRLPSRAGH